MTKFGNVAVGGGADRRISRSPLPDLDPENFSNRHVFFTSLPPGLCDKSSSEFCFEPGDPRFAFVHAIFHTTSILLHHERLLAETGGQPIGRIEIEIHAMDIPAGRTSANADGKKLTLRGSPVIDETTIAHEIGHVIHGHLQRDALETASRGSRTSPAVNELVTVQEAVADVLAAFFLGEPVVDRDQFEPRNLEARIRVAEVRSIRDSFLTALGDEVFRATWPQNVATLRAMLAGTHPAAAVVDFPDPYQGSLTLSGPIWRTARRFGMERIERWFIGELSRSFYSTRRDFALGLVDSLLSRGDEESGRFLRREFGEAGVGKG